MTAEMFGADWKVKLDSYVKDVCIVDLKVMKSIRELNYVKDFGHMHFVSYLGIRHSSGSISGSCV